VLDLGNCSCPEFFSVELAPLVPPKQGIEMKKLGLAFVAALSLSFPCVTGCGKGETKVIEAPPVEENDGAVEGMSDEEYNKQMEESMRQQGN
jgi:hypothetical protein